MSAVVKNPVFWLVAVLALFLFWSVSSRIQERGRERELSFSEFMVQLDRGHVSKVVITGTRAGSEIVGEFKNGQSIRTFAPPQAEALIDTLLDKGVDVTARDAESASWLGHVVSWTPIVFMIAFLIYFMRSVQGSGSKVSPVVQLRERQERRLEMKARFLNALSSAPGALSAEEMLSQLSRREIVGLEDLEGRKALYEMLSEKTVVMTEDKKYRLRTTS